MFEWLCCNSTSCLICEKAREWEMLSWIILLKDEWGVRIPWAFCWFSTCKFHLWPCLIYLLCYCGVCINSLCVLHVFQFCISNFSIWAINHSHIYFQICYIIFNLYINLCQMTNPVPSWLFELAHYLPCTLYYLKNEGHYKMGFILKNCIMVYFI